MIFMWDFLKKLFSNKENKDELNIQNKEIDQAPDVSQKLSESTIPKNDETQEIVHSNFDFCQEEDNYVYGFSHKKLSEFEILLLKLKDYSGYIRQKTLESLANCFDAELFPHLLNRLSDYIPINRQLAAEQITKWSERPEFSQLCMVHFLEITTLQKRERTEQRVFQLLLEKIGQNQKVLQEGLTEQQGLLPRELLKFTIQQQWIESAVLFELCKNAKDQHVRAHWLENLILNQNDIELIAELKETKYRDVKYRLFDVLYQRQALKTDDLIDMWHSPYVSVMDYAYFTLRQQKFDFNNYFLKNPLHTLTHAQARIRACQWIMMKGDLAQFYQILDQVENHIIVKALMKYAVKQQYIQFEQYLNYFQNIRQKLVLADVLKTKKLSKHHLNVDELQQMTLLLDDEVTLQQKLDWVEDLHVWDKLYWYVIQFSHDQTLEEKALFRQVTDHLMLNMQYITHSPAWSSEQMHSFRQKLPVFIQAFPQVLEHQKIRQILQTKLNIANLDH